MHKGVLDHGPVNGMKRISRWAWRAFRYSGTTATPMPRATSVQIVSCPLTRALMRRVTPIAWAVCSNTLLMPLSRFSSICSKGSSCA
ncbi:hypothetical protein D3C77_727530 [compost metagenome]